MRVETPQVLLERLRRRGGLDPALAEAEERVRPILRSVREQGDAAVCEWTERFDGVRLAPETLEVSRSEWADLAARVPEELRRAIRRTAARIEAFHRRQVPRGYDFREASGNLLGQLVRPLDRVGCYVPGGRAAYPSTVLMTAIPAWLAGVREVAVCTPPGPQGEVSPLVAYACLEAGVHRLFRVGGAQAIAALAYGTEAIPRADKIVGPGNLYVTAAKRLVFGVVDIDGLAGPSEVVVVADERARPEWVALDLLAQAEHDPAAFCVLLTPSTDLAEAVRRSLERRLAEAPRREIAAAALEDHGLLVVVEDLEMALTLVNQIAPEHLCLQVAEPFAALERVRHAGAVFLGDWAPVPAGDYAAGTNHVLPTAGTARFFSPLSVGDFVKRVNFFYSTPEGVADWGEASQILAEREGLFAHGAAIAERRAARRDAG